MPTCWKLPRLGMSNMNFVIADMIQFVSGRMTTFAQGDGTKIKSSSSQSLAPRLKVQPGQIGRQVAKKIATCSTSLSTFPEEV